jgi:hypothetical protein
MGGTSGYSLVVITTRCRTATVATILMLAVLALLSFAQPAGAIEQPLIMAERAAAATVLVREGDVVDEDLYAGGNRVLIEGTVKGDLVVAAFQALEISGSVEGDVVGYSPLVVISGTVGGSLRVAADVVRVDGAVGVDVFTGARSTVVTGTVGRDLQAWTLSLDVRAVVERDILGRVFDRARIGGTIGRDVEITVRDLEVVSGTRIEGSLGYRSDREADLAADVEVGRAITQRDPVTPNVRVQAIFTLTGVLVFLAVAGLGFLLFWLMPRTLQMAVDRLQSRTLLALGVGLVVLVLPLAALFLVVVLVVDSSPELALPTAIIGLPIGVLLVGMLLFGLLVSPVPVLTVLGSRLTRQRRSTLFGYLIGLLLWGLLLAIPTVRVFITALTALLGLGAWTLGLVAARGRYQWALWPPGKHRQTPAEEAPMVQQPELAPAALLIDEGEWPQEEIGEPFDPEALKLPFEED